MAKKSIVQESLKTWTIDFIFRKEAMWKAASSDDKNIYWDLDTPEEHYNEGVPAFE